MKTKYIALALFFALHIAYSQEAKFDESLAKSLNGDDRGMKKYVFCLLKTGSNLTATEEEKANLFKGHMQNISTLAKEGKLAIAGPFMKNDINYRGIFILNVTTIEEAKLLVDSDPAVKANLLEAELTPWYGSAALMKVNEIHKTIVKGK